MQWSLHANDMFHLSPDMPIQCQSPSLPNSSTTWIELNGGLLGSILSNDRFVNPCLFTIYIFEGHDCDETKLHFFSKKTWYFASDNKLSFSQFWWIRQQWFEHAILQQYQIINSCFCHQYRSADGITCTSYQVRRKMVLLHTWCWIIGFFAKLLGWSK